MWSDIVIQLNILLKKKGKNYEIKLMKLVTYL